MTETDIWTKWESQIVNGVFPLRRFLGRSNHSVVFLTECRAQNLPNAAIKIIPADPALAEAQLSRWRSAAALSHPYLIRLLDSGRCKLGGHPFLFVVTEYAEQNLAQILPHRALTADEVRELLGPTLDALGFLHGKNLVHGQLKPPNFLVVNDQLKLSSDGVRAFREPAAALARPSLYDAPEAKSGGITATGDVWSLGATLIEAMTQHPPSTDKQLDIALLPATFPAALADKVWRCLSRDPADRPTLADLRNQISPTPDAPAVPNTTAPAMAAATTTASPTAPAPPMATAPTAAAAAPVKAREPNAPAASRRTASFPAWLTPPVIARAVAAGLLGVILLWIGIRAFRSHPASPPPVALLPVPQSPAPVAQSPTTPPSTASAVVHEEIPAVSRGARASVRGQIKVVVRVTVDRAGNVIAENLEARGSSRYFARVAMEAAKRWKFAPADNQSPREWLLQFEFSRDGATAHAVPRAKP
ncbi:MAG TPA: protein kinase [Steroidobacteraceae bacterium]|nr:protein kinase [Steroidobacteraceae bacterium]